MTDASSQPDDEDNSQQGTEETGMGRPVSRANVVADSSFSLRGCKIGRGDLDRIVALAAQGFSSDANITVTTVRKSGIIDSTVKAESVEDLLESSRAAILPGDPMNIDNLAYYVREGDRYVSLRIKASSDPLEDGVSVSLSGDPEWVRGRGSSLRDLLKETQSSIVTGRGFLRIVIVALGVFLSLVGEVIYLLNFSLHIAVLLLVSTVAVLCGGGFFAGAMLDRRWRTRFLLLPVSTRSKESHIAVISLVVGILGVIIAIIGVLVAHSDAHHP